MDIASFIATVTDPNLRREIFANMDEATIATLPPNLMAEARNLQNSMRYERQRARYGLENIDRRVRGLIEQIDPRRGGRGGFGAGYGYGRGDDLFGGRGREEVKA
jgi:hypothetical protein